MKKKKLFILLSLFLLAFGITPANADNRAVKIEGEICGLLGVNFLSNPGDVIITYDSQVTATKSRAGVRSMKCETDLTTVPTDGSAINYDFGNTGLMCGILTDSGFVETDKWHETISAEGHVTLHCVYVLPPT